MGIQILGLPPAFLFLLDNPNANPGDAQAIQFKVDGVGAFFYGSFSENPDSAFVVKQEQSQLCFCCRFCEYICRRLVPIIPKLTLPTSEHVAAMGRRTTAFSLSLAGGILIASGGAIGVFWMNPMMTCCQGIGMMQGMMGSFGFGIMYGLFMVSIVSGAIVLLGAIMLNRKPEQRYTCGLVIIIFSATSILGMGGFLVGSILGIVGGILALDAS